MPDLTARLNLLFDAERTARALHEELAGGDKRALAAELVKQAKAAMTLEEAEAELRLVRLADLLGEIEGDPSVVDALIDILDSSLAEARGVAAEILGAIAFERFKEVALGIERALDRLPAGSPALSELPYLLAEVGEPGCVKLIGRFLQHQDAEAVASAIEALAELGDPVGASLLGPLLKDARQVDIDGESGLVSIGVLAEEARALLVDVGSVRDRRPGK